MKKLLIFILMISIVASFAACGGNSGNKEVADSESVIESDKIQEDIITEDIVEEKEEEETQKEEVQKPTQPSQKPETKPEEKPSQAPSVEDTTLGKTLLADFKSKASSQMSAEEIAQGLMNNSAIKFGGGVTAVEEGLLSGFDNAQITGFKSGYMIAPMIGSIPFVGYVFELENEADASAFVANLEKNANPRWNICVEAEETVSGSFGNKVFFVMCPTTLEE